MHALAGGILTVSSPNRRSTSIPRAASPANSSMGWSDELAGLATRGFGTLADASTTPTIQIAGHPRCLEWTSQPQAGRTGRHGPQWSKGASTECQQASWWLHWALLQPPGHAWAGNWVGGRWVGPWVGGSCGGGGAARMVVVMVEAALWRWRYRDGSANCTHVFLMTDLPVPSSNASITSSICAVFPSSGMLCAVVSCASRAFRCIARGPRSRRPPVRP